MNPEFSPGVGLIRRPPPTYDRPPVTNPREPCKMLSIHIMSLLVLAGDLSSTRDSQLSRLVLENDLVRRLIGGD